LLEDSLEGKLIEAKELNSQSAPDAVRKPFSLQFKLAPGLGLGQGPVLLRHEKLQEADAFLVPIGADEDGWYMEACFN
jgi:hypothetical protein